MSKYISKEEIMQHAVTKNSVVYIPLQDILHAQTVDIPHEYGHWVLDPNGMDWNIPAWRCSECGCRNNAIPVWTYDSKGRSQKCTDPLAYAGTSFCPGCRADMRGPQAEQSAPVKTIPAKETQGCLTVLFYCQSMVAHRQVAHIEKTGWIKSAGDLLGMLDLYSDPIVYGSFEKFSNDSRCDIDIKFAGNEDIENIMFPLKPERGNRTGEVICWGTKNHASNCNNMIKEPFLYPQEGISVEYRVRQWVSQMYSLTIPENDFSGIGDIGAFAEYIYAHEQNWKAIDGVMELENEYGIIDENDLVSINGIDIGNIKFPLVLTT